MAGETGTDYGAITSGIGQGLGGLEQLGYATGLFKTPEQRAQEEQRKYAEARRNAILSYLQANMPNWQEPDFQFDPEQYKDVTGLMEEQQGKQQQGLLNQMALSGQGRGGIGTEMTSRLGRQQGTDFNRMMTELRRTEEEKNRQRAMERYKMKMDKTTQMAQYQ